MTRLFGAPIIADETARRRVEGHVRHREPGTPRSKGIRHRPALSEILAGNGTPAVAGTA